MKTRISVCIATYNGAIFIKKQLISILDQLSSEDEIIISDDNSSDNTIEIVNSFRDDRIRIVYNTGEKGYVSNFENALRNALGNYIILSDQDDIWKSNKVETLLNNLKTYDFVVSDAILVDEKDNVISDSFFLERKPYRGLIGNIYKFGYLGCCMAFKKEVLDRALPFPTNRKYCTHDNWLFLIGASFFDCKVLDDRLIYYRRHRKNVSDGGLKNNTSLRFKLMYRLYLLKSLLQRCSI